MNLNFILFPVLCRLTFVNAAVELYMMCDWMILSVRSCDNLPVCPQVSFVIRIEDSSACSGPRYRCRHDPIVYGGLELNCGRR
ncbi:hypothetical protein V1521DRAFT_442429 [Lipomyces starkeyi]